MPGLPPHFQPRREELEALKQQVLADANQRVVLTGTSRRVGVQGMGGIGKSVLAAALGRDEEVRQTFPDGIIWIPVGQTPQITTWQAFVAKALGDTQAGFTDENLGKAHLRQLLAQKACLLILDDIWEVKHAAAFEVLGEKCQMLITSRDAGLITSLGAKEYKLGVLSDEQALALLAEWADQPRETLPETARQVATECGNLPLALAMIGAMVRGKPNRWENVLQKLRNADLEKIRQQFPDYPYPDLLKAIQVSVEALEPNVKERYLDFAVFPEDTPIPETVLQTFWEPQGLDEFDTQDVVDELVNKSLAQRDEKGLSLHDLQFDYVRKQAKDLSELHNRLLSAYAEKCSDGWHSAENDGYFFGQLGYHLLAAKRAEEFRQLLFDFRWLQAKLDHTSVTELIADYELMFPISATNVSPSKVSGEEEKTLKLVQGAIRLSAHILEKDKTQLAGQLWGRLLSFDVPEIREMLEVLKQRQTAPWLRLFTPTLTPPGGALLRTLTGHTEWVRGVAISPDGKFAVSASEDKTLKVWNLDSGKKIKTLTGHKDWVTAVAISPDGKLIVSASMDKTLKIWDLKLGKELKTLSGHNEGITAVAIAPDGKLIVSASIDKTLKIWDLDSGNECKTLTGHTKWVEAVAIAPSGKFAVSASRDNRLKVWDWKSGQEIKTLTGHTNWVKAVAVAISRLGKLVVSASMDKTLIVWDLESGQAIKTLIGHTEAVNAVAIAPSGKFVVSASMDKTLIVWDVESGKEIKPLTGHTEGLTGVAIAPHSCSVISASVDRTLKVWDLEFSKELQSRSRHTKLVTAVAISPSDELAVSASMDKTLKIWDLKLGKELKTLSAHTQELKGVAIAPSCKFAIFALEDNTLKVWDLESNKELKTLAGHTNLITAVAIAPSYQFAISASYDNILKVWDLESGYEVKKLSINTDLVTAVAIAPNDKFAIFASVDCTLTLWDLDSSNLFKTLSGHINLVREIAISSDSKFAVSASEDKTLILWDLDSGNLLKILSEHTESVKKVAISTDGKLAFSASNDNTLKVWDLATGKNIATFTAEDRLYSCNVARDGVTIVAGEWSGRVHFLRLEGVDKTRILNTETSI